MSREPFSNILESHVTENIKIIMVLLYVNANTVGTKIKSQTNQEWIIYIS